MQNFQDIEHFVKTLSAAIKKKIPTKVSQLTNDAGYKTTDTTYKLSKTGSTVTLTGSDGSTTSVADSNTTYSSLKNPYSLTIQNNGTTVASYDGSTAKTANFTNATASADGLMSKADKAKLDGISSGADAVTIKTVKVNGTALTPDSNKAVNVTVPTLANNATTTTGGMALDARMGKTLSDQILSVKAGAIDQIVNLTAAGWTGDAAPYSQVVNVTGMTSELLCELFSSCPKSATVAERKAYNKAYAIVASGYAETADGKVTFSVDEKPVIDIGVRIKSISKANAVSDQTSSDISNAVDAMSNTLWEKIYPVGSIYISANSTSPAELFGGTWEQIKDRFLLAAGDTYAAGSTGGEATHTLTVDEMPSHRHLPYIDGNTISDDFRLFMGDDNWFNDAVGTSQFRVTRNYGTRYKGFEAKTNTVGGSKPHNNMPPYLAVYVWKRVS